MRVPASRAIRHRLMSALAFTAVSCAQERQTTDPGLDVSIARYLTAGVASHLGSDGRLVLLEPTGDTLSSAAAIRIADAYLRLYGPPALRYYFSASGREFSLDRVHSCGRAFITSSPYELSAIRDEPMRRRLGAHWLCHFCLEGRTPVLSVSVSALAVEAALAVGRGEHFDPDLADVRELPIPIRIAEIPVSPERAVAFAASLTSTRVAGLPELVQPPSGRYPQLARWRLVLERPIRARATSSGIASDEQVVYVGWEREVGPLLLLRAKLSQRDVDSIRVASASSRTGMAVPRRSSMPFEFERIETVFPGISP